MKDLLFILLLLAGHFCVAQVSRDTSFTLRATYEKEKKKFPFIEIARREPGKQISIAREIAYRTINGRTLKLDVFYPKKSKPVAAILLIFGGGWKSGDRSQNETMAIDLANHGFVAISADYRLSPEALYPAALYDLKAAIRWMCARAKTYHIDTSKISVLGCSAGGQLAALIGTTNHQPRFQDSIGFTRYSSAVLSVIDIDGILAFKHPESAEGFVASQWLGGTYEQRPAQWEQASALTHVGPQTPPILFLNSSQPRFHAGRDDMIRQLDNFHIYSEIHTFPDTPHPFWFFQPWFDPMMEHIIKFLQRKAR